MPSLTTVRNKANTVLAALWSELATRQDAYFAKHGRYFQLLVSPTTQVADGGEATFSIRLPSYEDKLADAVLSYTASVPCTIQIHQGTGGVTNYLGIVRLTYAGTLYERRKTSDGVDTGWYIVEPVN